MNTDQRAARRIWPDAVRRLVWLAVAVAVAFAAGVAAGSRRRDGGRTVAPPIRAVGPVRVGPPPWSQRDAGRITPAGVPPGATFVAYITGPVDPRVAAQRCEETAQQDACAERPDLPAGGAH